MSIAFTHLHLHSQYTISESTIIVGKLPDVLIERGFDSCAITDIGNMFGAIDFYSSLKSKGIHPVIGLHTFIANGGHRRRNYDPNDIAHDSVVLLCRNNKGYKNLVKLSSLAYTEGLYRDTPRIDDDLLKNYHEGLVLLSGGIQSKIYRLILENNAAEVPHEVEYYRELFGDRYFVELQADGSIENLRVNRMLADIAEKIGVPCVATVGCRYFSRKNALACHILDLMGKQRKTMDGDEEPATDELYIKSAAEMQTLFADFSQAYLTNTHALAMSCQVSLEKEKDHLPDFPCEVGKTVQQQFSDNCYAGLENRLAYLSQIYQWDESAKVTQRELYRKRLAYEIDIILTKDYPGYFLIVSDFVRWAKQNGISVGPGRGSGAGSIAAYALEITDVDPIRYELLFERFLNPERVSMPDFDIDFEASGRERVIDYVKQKYGEEKVCQISSIGTLQAKGVVKGVARVMGINYSEAERVVKLIPEGQKVTLADSLRKVPELNDMLEIGTEKEQKLMRVSLELEGACSNLTTHAAGVIIMSSDITDYIPVCLSPQGIRQSQYSMEFAEKQGAIKFDFLGLKNLSIIDETIALIRQQGVEPPDLSKLGFNDPRVFDLLKQGDSTGVFQLESQGMRNLLRSMKPDKFEDIIALIALFRPGPLEGGMVEDFVARKHGLKKIEYLHPLLSQVLDVTYGVMVYQEQVMRVTQLMAGFTLGQADELRRAIGKKKADVLAAQKNDFVSGCLTNGVDTTVAEKVFDLIEKFAGYGFNKSHSAAYAVIGYQTAYLRVHFPLAFFCALMTTNMRDTDEIVNLVTRCRAVGINVLPPDIMKSEHGFTVEGNAIRFGFGGIKTVGGVAIEQLITARKKRGQLNDLTGLLRELKQTINSQVLEGLIKAGAFDSLSPNRRMLFEGVGTIILFLQGIRRLEEMQEENLFAAISDSDEEECKLELPYVEPWSVAERLRHEYEALGIALSAHLLDEYEAEYRKINGLMTLSAAEEKTLRFFHEEGHHQPSQKSIECLVLAIITEKRSRTTKDGKGFGVVKLQDKQHEFEGTLWRKAFETLMPRIELNVPLLIKAHARLNHNRGTVSFDIENVMSMDAYRLQYTKYIELKGSRITLEKLNDCISRHQDTTGQGISLIMLIPFKDRYEFAVKTNVALRREQAMLDYLRENMTGCRISFIYNEAYPEEVLSAVSPEEPEESASNSGDYEDLPEFELVTDRELSLN